MVCTVLCIGFGTRIAIRILYLLTNFISFYFFKTDSLEDEMQKDFIRKCLRKTPEERPTARELLFHPVLFEVHSLKLLAAHILVNTPGKYIQKRSVNLERKFWCLQFSPKTNLKMLIFALVYWGRNFSFVFWENWINKKALSKLTDLYHCPNGP